MASYPIVIPPSACAPASIPTPSLLPGISILSVDAAVVANYSATVLASENANHATVDAAGVDFCNVTVTYTHPGASDDDRVGVEAWLPLSTWNGRFQAAGGAGWFAGRVIVADKTMVAAVGEGYVAASTDAGQGRLWALDGAVPSSAVPTWALASEGEINDAVVDDFFHVAIGEMPVLVKEVIENFYGQGPEYSYFSGCSQGGRQGLALAQRYPDAYDGIAASSPGLGFQSAIPAMLYSHVLMQDLGVVPQPCELDYITHKAIEACDPLDGVVDGLVAWETECDFDPFTLVGDKFVCAATNATLTLTEAVATIANATWTGPHGKDGNKVLWPGPKIDTSISGTGSPSGAGVAMTTCTADGTCTPVELGFGEDWAAYFVEKNTSWSWKGLTPDSYSALLERSADEWSELAATNNPDLSAFRAAGGKMLTYHGTADELLPFRGVAAYYDTVLKADAAAQDFYRFFPVNGLGHCLGGAGGQPTGVFEALRRWVEEGVAPDELEVTATAQDGSKRGRKLCPYPQHAALQKGASPDTVDAEDWACEE